MASVAAKLDSEVSEVSEVIHSSGLTEEICNQKISDEHFEIISREFIGDGNLVPHFKLQQIDWEDIQAVHSNPSAQRYQLLIKWKQRHPADATYLNLIAFLLRIKRRQDAEGVCDLHK